MFNIQKVANIDEEFSCEAFKVFRFLTVDQEIRHIQIERGRSRNANNVYRELLRANAPCRPTTPKPDSWFSERSTSKPLVDCIMPHV
jgi:hypothetical protein